MLRKALATRQATCSFVSVTDRGGFVSGGAGVAPPETGVLLLLLLLLLLI